MRCRLVARSRGGQGRFPCTTRTPGPWHWELSRRPCRAEARCRSGGIGSAAGTPLRRRHALSIARSLSLRERCACGRRCEGSNPIVAAPSREVSGNGVCESSTEGCLQVTTGCWHEQTYKHDSRSAAEGGALPRRRYAPRPLRAARGPFHPAPFSCLTYLSRAQGGSKPCLFPLPVFTYLSSCRAAA